MKLRDIADFSLIIPWAIAFGGCLTIATVLAPNQLVQANTIRQVAASQVSGENAQLQTVKVWPGHGVSIWGKSSEAVTSRHVTAVTFTQT